MDLFVFQLMQSLLTNILWASVWPLDVLWSRLDALLKPWDKICRDLWL
jgi:hypothetical protein